MKKHPEAAGAVLRGFRPSFAASYLHSQTGGRTVPEQTIRALMGHAARDSHEGYCHSTDEEAERAVLMLTLKDRIETEEKTKKQAGKEASAG